MSYRKQLWGHRPVTDFWRVGSGYRKRLESLGIYTMGDIAAYSLQNEEKLYKMFGINAELLIDHAWGWEPCTIADIKAYQPENRSISQGHVLSCPYSFEKGRLIVKEMTDQLVLDLVQKGLVTDQMILTVGYDTAGVPENYSGKFENDRYGKKVPKPAHGSQRLEFPTSSTKEITAAVLKIYDTVVNRKLMVRRMYVVANHVVRNETIDNEQPVQFSLFEDTDVTQQIQEKRKAELERERRLQKAVISIKEKYGKNAILKGMNFQEGATAIERNGQVGGHKA